MRLGVYLPVSFPDRTPPAREIADYAMAAEDLGFDSLWIGDHLRWRAPMAEPLTTLSYVAARTTRIRLGINVFLAALRPAALSARMLGNLWWLADGRLVLGVGVGGDNVADFEAVDVPVGRRGALLDAALDGIADWWSDGGVLPRPETPCPIWVGGRSEAALARVVRRRADGFTAHLVTPDQLGRHVTRLREMCAEAGAPMPEVAATVMVNVHDGASDARSFLRAHFGDDFRGGRYLVEGPPAECAEQLQNFASIVDHLILLPATFTALPQLSVMRELVETQ